MTSSITYIAHFQTETLFWRFQSCFNVTVLSQKVSNLNNTYTLVSRRFISFLQSVEHLCNRNTVSGVRETCPCYYNDLRKHFLRTSGNTSSSGNTTLLYEYEHVIYIKYVCNTNTLCICLRCARYKTTSSFPILQFSSIFRNCII